MVMLKLESLFRVFSGPERGSARCIGERNLLSVPRTEPRRELQLGGMTYIYINFV